MHLETDLGYLADDDCPFDWAECGQLVELADLTWRPALVTCPACIAARALELREARAAIVAYLGLARLLRRWSVPHQRT